MSQENANNKIYTVNECASIGGITVGMDSLKAVNLIKSRLTQVVGSHDVSSLLTTTDSIGYYYAPTNEKYFITLDNSKVIRIYFHSNALTDNDVKIIVGGNKYDKNKIIYHKGKTWTAYQNGMGTYVIFKQ